jgi:hypothetical protein
VIFSQAVSGSPIALSSPLTVSSTGFLNYTTEASIQTGFTINTPTVLQYDSFFAGDTQMFGAGQNFSGGNARVNLNSQFSVTLSEPGTVTFTSYNTAQSSFVQNPLQGGAANRIKIFWLNGTLVHSTYSNGSYTFPLAAGSHSFEELQDVASIFSGPPNSVASFGTSRTRIRIESVPEPATMLALGLGVAALLRRSKKK